MGIKKSSEKKAQHYFPSNTRHSAVNNRRLPQLHKTISQVRKIAGISQIKLAEILEVHQSAISRIESGRQEMSAYGLYQFAEYFGLSADFILIGEIDYVSLAKRFGRPIPLPEAYQAPPYIKGRAIMPFKSLLEENLSKEAYENSLSHLGLLDHLTQSPDQIFGFQAYLDIAEESIRRGVFGADQIDDLTKHWFTDDYHRTIAPLFRIAKNPIEIFQIWHFNHSRYSEAFSYRIESVHGIERLRLKIKTTESFDINRFEDSLYSELHDLVQINYFRRLLENTINQKNVVFSLLNKNTDETINWLYEVSFQS